MTPTETKLGSPQLFVVSICSSNEVSTKLVQADTWQEAVLDAANSSAPGAMENTDILPDGTSNSDLRILYPTIRSLKSSMWAHELVSFSIGIIRPAVTAVDTGYVKSDDGPISATTIKVAVEHMSLYDDVVYVP